MATDVLIAKLALSNVGDRWDLTALTDNTTEAEQVNLVFDIVRNTLLREHPWKFAQKWSSPAALGGTVPNNWDYMYAYPSDAIRVSKIINPLGDEAPAIPFDVGLNSSDVKVLLTDEAEPEFQYTKKVTDASLYDDAFVTALSLRLATAIALPITGDRGLLQTIATLALNAVGKAMEDDANEAVQAEQDYGPDWVEARQ